MVRILWSSNAPWASSGYGNQTALIPTRLRSKGHEIALVCWYGLHGGIIYWNGLRCYPGGAHPYGCDVLTPHSLDWNADISITLIDAWVYENAPIAPSVRWCPYFPVDSEPIEPRVASTVRNAFARIVFSKSACHELDALGMDYYYAPHCVDTNIYKPYPKQESRLMLRLPTDCFLAGMVAANTGWLSRKSFPQALEAFAMLARKYDDVRLYIHSAAGGDPNGNSIDLPGLINALGLQRHAFLIDAYSYLIGMPMEHMARIYSAMDVLLSPSMGEGFGIPILEAQACGVPVITGGWTSMPEITFAGWVIPKRKAEKFWRSHHNSWQYLPRISAIYERLEAAYHLNAEQKEELAKKARAGAMKYDADHVIDKYWVPILNDLNERVQRSKKLEQLTMQPLQSVPPLPLDGNSGKQPMALPNEVKHLITK
jgi:glycosyltransferase involved in cell wall biosynthesis